MTPARAPRVVLAWLLGFGLAAAPAVAANPATISESFGAATIPQGGSTSLTFAIYNPNQGVGLSGINFTDTLPAGLRVATPSALSSGCDGTPTATAGSSSVSLTGTSLTPGAVCVVSVNVTGTFAGKKDNTVTVNSSAGASGPSMASVTVVSPPYLSAEFATSLAGSLRNWVASGGSVALRFRIDNYNDSVGLTGVGFTDNLPDGLAVAAPNGLSGGCGTGSVTAAPGSRAITLSHGTIAASSHCDFSVRLRGSGNGIVTNSSGPITSNEGGNGDPILPRPISIIGPGGRVYWAGVDNAVFTSWLSFARSDGTVAADLAALGTTTVEGVAIDAAAGRIYFAARGTPATIAYVNLDGSGGGTLDTGTATVSDPFGVAIGPNRRLYWANGGANKISYANLDGSGGRDLSITGTSVMAPTGVAVDPVGRRIYWANSNGGVAIYNISSAKLDGSDGRILDTGMATMGEPRGVAVDSAARRIYWANGNPYNVISYAKLDGSGGSDLPIDSSEVQGPVGIAIDPAADRLYWGNRAHIAFASRSGIGAADLPTPGAIPAYPVFVALIEPPISARPPTIAGGSTAGSLLSCSQGGWAADLLGEFLSRAPQRFAYRWTRDGKPLANAGGKSYRARLAGRYSCGVSGSNAAGSASSSSSASHAVTPDTRITRSRIKRAKRRASLSFKTIGGGSGFQCSLVKLKQHRPAPKARFGKCRSPKTYRNIAHGRYLFEVRSRSSVGPDPTPATKHFRI